MITYVDLAPLPHIRLVLRVPVSLPAGGWSWGESAMYPGELTRDYAYNDDECRSLVHSYGRTITRVMSRRDIGDRFQVCAWGVTTGLMVGMREWEWSTDLRDYNRVGEYLSGWKEAIRAYYLRTGQYFEDKRFEARSGLTMRCDLASMVPLLSAVPTQTVRNVPHVRHREDVPHEGALPNLYGLRSA